MCARASSKIMIISPYITKEALVSILSEVSNKVCINVIVGTRSSYIEIKKAEHVLGKEIRAKLRGRVHCKAVLTDHEVCVGSANITMSGLKRSHEASVITNDPSIVNSAHCFFNLFWNNVVYEEPYYSDFRTINTRTNSVFVTSIRNLPPLILELARYAKENIIFTTPTYTIDAMEILLNHIGSDVHIEAFVKLDENDWAERGVSDPWAIRALLHKGATVWDVSLLHAKIFIVDHKIALISSLNLTNQAFQYIFDAGILTKDEDLIDSLIQFVSQLRKRRIEQEIFEEMLASFNTKLPFIEARLMQKEGDHFSDEEDPSYSKTRIKDIEVTPYKYPKHAGDEFNLPPPPKPLKRIRNKTIKPADIPAESEILIGKKPLIDYFKACIFIFLNKNKDSVTIKARGKWISKAVGLAQMFRHTVIKTKLIKIGSSKLIGPDGKMRNVSFIEIVLSKS